MKIAQIAPISERVPPKKYGGTERVVYELTESLIERGHDVTLFASGDSITSAKLFSVIPASLRELLLPNPYGLNEWSFLHIGLAYKRQNEFDIIHDHNYITSLPTANISATPVVNTIHGAFNKSNIPLYQAMDNIHYVTISKAQLPKNIKINHKGTVYHGLHMSHYPFGNKHNGYLLFVGRLSMEKGVHFAIQAAQELDLPLVIAARVDSVDIDYYKAYIKPKLSDKRIRWIGEVDEQQRNELMSKAMAFLHPVTWPEPFGLTMIEAMACGCPVVAFNKGSIPEVVADKKSGFVVNDLAEMISAIKKIDQIDRRYCREYALNKFDPERMVDQYEKIYEKILLETRMKQSKLISRNDKLLKKVDYIIHADVYLK